LHFLPGWRAGISCVINAKISLPNLHSNTSMPGGFKHPGGLIISIGMIKKLGRIHGNF
jgi:hypothetical protein